MAIHKVVHKGVEYTWIERGGRAMLSRGSEGLWWGDPTDPKKRRELLKFPEELLLAISVLRGES